MTDIYRPKTFYEVLQHEIMLSEKKKEKKRIKDD